MVMDVVQTVNFKRDIAASSIVLISQHVPYHVVTDN